MNSSLLSEFDFVLPPELIANAPVVPRDSSRLLHFKSEKVTDCIFNELPNLLPEKTLLIFNDTKVVKSRIKFKVGTRSAELFFASVKGINSYEVLCKPSALFKVGSSVTLPGDVELIVESITSDGTKIVKILDKSFDYFKYLDKYGEVPLPPYIDLGSHTANEFEELYQTVYSKSLGSVAAPTAGLHFTDELLQRLSISGVKTEFITLQVGLGTFLPIRVDNIDDHKMHSESFCISEESAQRINKYKSEGYTVICVGTTTLRALQSVFDKYGKIEAGYFETDIFIKPGYSNWFFDALITNFHLPKSTLFILISALIGVENAENIYKHAIKNRYRFYSFGDSSILWITDTK